MSNATTTFPKTFSIGGDLEVNRVGYGAMRITGKGIWGPPKDKAEAISVLKRAIELGVNFIDTADSYGPHISEELIAEALYPYPADLVIGTKAWFITYRARSVAGKLKSGAFKKRFRGQP
jgi:pyridoxine 4-dehydrogenase